MLLYILPIAVVVLCNIIYQVCAKSVPDSLNTFACLTVTYIISALASAAFYFLLNKDANLIQEFRHLNWAPFVLGVSLVGLEAGFIYAYKAGWTISTASIVQSAFLALALIGVGFLLYHEPITWNKVVGIIICLIGLAFISR